MVSDNDNSKMVLLEFYKSGDWGSKPQQVCPLCVHRAKLALTILNLSEAEATATGWRYSRTE